MIRNERREEEEKKSKGNIERRFPDKTGRSRIQFDTVECPRITVQSMIRRWKNSESSIDTRSMPENARHALHSRVVCEPRFFRTNETRATRVLERLYDYKMRKILRTFNKIPEQRRRRSSDISRTNIISIYRCSLFLAFTVGKLRWKNILFSCTVSGNDIARLYQRGVKIYDRFEYWNLDSAIWNISGKVKSKRM